jgi:hypothetical protein
MEFTSIRNIVLYISKTQNRKDLVALKSHIVKILKGQNISTTSSSRGGYHIRFPFEGDAKKFFEKHNLAVADYNKTISSKFETLSLVTTDDIGKIPIGTQIPWVNNYVGAVKTGSTLFANKALTPDNLGLAGKTVTSREISTIVDNQLGNKFDQSVVEALMHLIEVSNTKRNTIPLTDNPFTAQDLAKVSADFGEILAAVWSMNALRFRKAYFPTASNEPLIDFYGVRMGIQYPVSVKSGGGGKVTVQNIIDKIEGRAKTAGSRLDNEASLAIFKIVAQNSMKDQMIKLHQYMETDAIKKLGDIMDVRWNRITIKSIKDWVGDKSNAQLKLLLDPFWKELNMKLTERIIQGDDKVRLIISPLGESIWKILNNSKEIKTSLMNIARQVALIQVNVDVKKRTLNFEHNFFRDADFEFGWAGYAGGNKLGFKMKLVK